MYETANREFRWQGILKTAAIVLVSVLLMAAQSVQASTVYDIASDFNLISNPNGVWSYGWEAASASGPGGTLTLYDTHNTSQWFDSTHHSGDNTPTIWKNVGSGYSYGVAPGEVSLHPGWENSFSVLRWTSPIAGQVSAEGYFGAGDGGSMSYYIAMNGVVGSEWLTQTGTKSFSFLQTVNVGDTIDFIVGVPIGGGYGYGNTPVEARITSTVPVPGAMLLFSSGLAGLAGLRYRRRGR
jgi:hypothetical protein